MEELTKKQKNKKTKKVYLSAIILAKNEEKKIRGCLESVKWIDEIVLVDTGSTDKTVEIAKSFGAKVVDCEKGSYDTWRNKGLGKAKGEWVLYVDADERVTPSLRDGINQLINNSVNQHNVYAIPRRNIIFGREMRHGGWWPDYVKRLFKKDKLKKWVGDLHEEPIYEGKMGHLENFLIHIKHDNLSEMVEKTNKWSEIEARLLYKSAHPKMNIPRFMSAMFREFWLRMVKYKAFLDGGEGVIYAMYQVWSRFVTYAKLWEMQFKRDTNIRMRANDTNGYKLQ